MFRFRGRRKDNGEWVVGDLINHPYKDDYQIFNSFDGVSTWRAVHPQTLSIFTGKLDSKKEEIFASFPLHGVMTEGGDLVRTTLWGEAMVVYESGDNCAFKLNTINSSLGYIGGFPSESLTIIGKQGGGNV